MTDQERQDLINDIIVALKDEGVNIANATIETSLNNIMYFVGYDSNRKPIRLNVTAITDKTTTLSEAIAQEVARAQGKENELEEELDTTANELLKRIQGTSEKSDSALDAFKAYPKAFSSVQDEDFMPILDSMHGESSSIVGNWRMYIGRDHVEIKNIAIHYATDVWLQVFRGCYRYYANNNSFGIDSSNLQYNTYYRVHKNGAWSVWRNILDDVKDSVAELNNKINVLNGTGDGSVHKAVNTAIANLVGSSPETLDTIQEISEWILNDKTGAAAMAKAISENKTAIEAEATRAQEAESGLNDAIGLNYEDIVNLHDNVEKNAMQYNTLGVSTYADKAEIYGRNIAGTPRVVEFPSATTEKAGVMSAEDKKEQVKMTPLVNGDIIVGQAREIHSRNGKNVTDSFLVRTTAGSGTIGDGVATLKSVGGNIVKNLVDGTFESGWNAGDGTISKQNGIVTLTPNKKNAKIKLIKNQNYSKNVYYQRCAIRCTVAPDGLEVRFGVMNESGASLAGAVDYAKTTTEWHYLSCRFYNEIKSSLYNNISIVDRRDTPSDINATKCLFVNLTEKFGAGNEPTKEECDKLFSTIDALPQGLSIANPTEFKATGFNQFNPDNILVNKSIVDGAIVDGDKTLAVVPCLPCKVGVGENNGYCVHGEFGEDIKVYLTPLNPMEVTGELYMHELSKDETTQTYVPQIKGYLIVEVPTTDNLCVHLKWSADRNEYDYEPYHESKVKLPKVAEMSEYGLAGIQTSGTLACDEIDFEKGVYRKKIGAVDLGNNTFSMSGSLFVISEIDNILKPAYAKIANAVLDRYNIYRAYTVSTGEIGDKGYMVYTDGRLFIRDTTYTDVTSFKTAMQGVMLYYELAEPEEYPLPKVDNNYISSDYGVEQFNGGVPCNANNLYYMRSLAGETRNFLDRMYANTDKTDANDVADYITNGIEDNKQLATNAPNLALRALFVAAGAKYNDTDSVIEKIAPWGTEETWVKNNDGTYTYSEVPATVDHLPGHYYLNGLGDITEEQMMDIYRSVSWSISHNISNLFWNETFRTNFAPINKGLRELDALDGVIAKGAFMQNKSLEVAVVSAFDTPYNNAVYGIQVCNAASMFYGCKKLKHIIGILPSGMVADTTTLSTMFKSCPMLENIKLYSVKHNVSFSYSALISKESILYCITNAAPTSAITITLHPDAYARLADDAEIVAALEAQPLISLVSA